MDRRAPNKIEPIQSILKKPRGKSSDLVDKSNKIRKDSEKKKDGKKGKDGDDGTIPLPQGCTPLMYACQQGDYHAVVDILQKDPSSVSSRDRGLRCALHYCAEGGAKGAARSACADRLLMAAPGLKSARDADGLTPLHLAVVHGNVPLIQLLLASGADVQATDNENHTVVHWATVCGEVGALRAAVAGGADVATPDQHGGYPLHYAAQMCGAPATLDHQSRGAALEILRALLKAGARADVRDADGRTPLLWAASAGSAAAVLALVRAGADVDDADRDGLTALHCAASRGHTEVLETLLALCGAKVDCADTHGCTPLHYAATLGHADATALLLQHGADAHRQDRRGRSPAHTAAAKGQLETVRMLGARGTNLWLRNSKGDLPLHEAVASGRRELVKWLLDGRPSQVNATNHEGRTPLHVAASTDNADLCRVLLDRGADINAVAISSKNYHQTPLDCATSKGYRSTAKYLQMHGGLPASKIGNKQIVIDDMPISSLPTKRVTSTRIDVRDRIRIEKREVVEVPGGSFQTHRKSRRDNSYDSSDDSLEDNFDKERIYKRTSNRSRRARIQGKQKSFSDGYDTENEEKHENKKTFSNKKSKTKLFNSQRSRSEPSKREFYEKVSNCNINMNSESEDSMKCQKNKKKSKRQRKIVKSTSTTSPSSSSSDINEKKYSKRRGKKTSIHIETDNEKRTVNIVNFENVETKVVKQSGDAVSSIVDDSQPEKHKEQSGTETDTASIKNNKIVTEAQVHVQDSGTCSEIKVTIDSANNLSVETSNLKKDDSKSNLTDENKPNEVTNEEKHLDVVSNFADDTAKENSDALPEPVNENVSSTQQESVIIMDKKTDSIATTEDGHIQSKDDQKQEVNSFNENQNHADIQMESVNQQRKRSFEVLTEIENDALTEAPKEEVMETDPMAEDNSKQLIDNGQSDNEQKDKFNEHPMGEKIEPITLAKQSEKSKMFASSTISSSEMTQSFETDNPESRKGLLGVVSDHTVEDRAVQQVFIDSTSDGQIPPETSPKRSRKSSKESIRSRKGSIYETESYKVLSEMTSASEATVGILKKNNAVKNVMDEVNYDSEIHKKDTLGRVPSLSDNEMYNEEANGRRKRFRKKTKDKSKGMIRSKSENSERGYESSGMMDSGFEPSPRVLNQRALSPRLAAYYKQRNASGRYSGKSDSRIPVRKPGDKYAVDMKSVTQKIQTNMRRYYCERRIFQYLLELKRLQIRSSKTNEAVLVKRAIDEYNRSSLATVGLGPYNSPDFSFSSFEKFLYNSLRKLQKSGKRHLEGLPESSVEFDYGESELYRLGGIPDNPCLCTSKTHRCFHAVHAYTGIPCSAYIPPKLNHHTMPKPSTAGGKALSFLPKIDRKPPHGKAHVTLEVAHGTERQLISLPAEKLEKNKRYYVTFTVKGSNPTSDNENPSEMKNLQRKSL